MKTISRLILITVICCAASLTAPAQQSYEPPLTNAAVVKLVKAGFKEKTVITIIRSRPNRFNLGPDKLIELKKSGVSENIILAMLALDESVVFSDDDWSTDSTLKGGMGRSGDDPNKQSGGSDIFGSGSSSSSQSGGRGTDGGNQGETMTTGSATVRILRPPAEAGGATALKLEKTPTLTNDAVIKLVEAGFSEGTIIKRIEDSPADFDLSTAKLEELRKRRVTDPIIAAMTAAMGDEPGAAQSPRGSKAN
jgi:hypothetical protein